MMNFNSNYGMGGIGSGASTWVHMYGPLIFLVVIWSIFWKGLALWHSARRGRAWWFVIILIINTFGILEIVYLFGVLRLKFSQLFHKLK